MVNKNKTESAMNRDLHPHKAARIAMLIYGSRYAAQSLGSMDFWDSLLESEKWTCREALAEVLSAPSEGEPGR